MNRAMVIGSICLLYVGGCTSYYKVHDPTTGRDYYTTDLREKSGGAATLKDGRSGNTVNLQNSEVQKITKEQYEAARFTAPRESEKPAANPFQ